MRGALLAIASIVFAFNSFSAERASLSGLNPGDFVQVECRWRNVDVPQTASVCPCVKAFDVLGNMVFQRRVSSPGRRGFLPDDPEVMRWQTNYLVDGGPKPPSDAEVSFTRLPSNTVSVVADISAKGDKATFRDVEVSVVRGELKPRRKSSRPPLEWHGRELSDVELDAALASRPKARATISRDGDRTTMTLNGVSFVPRIYKSTQLNYPMRSKIVAAFTNDGFNVFFVPVRFGGRDVSDADVIWRQNGSVDVARVRDELRKYLRWNPAANLVLEVIVQPPRGWGEAHPEECYRNENGGYAYWSHHRICEYGPDPEPPPKSQLSSTPSYASAIFAEAMSVALGMLMKGIDESPEGKAILGFFFGGGTDEQWLDLFDNGVKPWQMGDYSDVARRRFREYLAKKYGTVEKMNSAYGMDFAASFAEAKIPSTAELTSEERAFFRVHGSTPQSDYREFMAKVATASRLKVAAAVKAATGRRILFGGYSPHGGLSAYPLYAQSASGMLMGSPDMDFFTIVPGYIREFCDPIRFAAFDGSMVRRGKLFVGELDLRSVDSNQFWGRWKEPFWQEVHSRETFRRKAMHYAANAIVHGGVYHAYDMDGGWFNSTSDQSAWLAANTMAAAARAMPPADERIALVGGERYCDFYSSQRGRGLAYPLLEFIPKALQRSGVPWNAYLLDELLSDENAKLPKVVLLSDATTMTAADFSKFRSRYCKDGRVVVYFWRPGLFAADGAAIDRALGLKNAPQAEGKYIVGARKAGDRLTEGLKGTFAAAYSEQVASEIAVAAGVGWKPLMFFEGTDVPGVSVRRGADCTEVHIALPGAITAQFCRNLAKEAGFDPLVESDELSGCGSGIFYMVAQSSGRKLFRLPNGNAPDKVLCGSSIRHMEDGRLAVDMKIGEIFVLSYKSNCRIKSEANN